MQSHEGYEMKSQEQSMEVEAMTIGMVVIYVLLLFMIVLFSTEDSALTRQFQERELGLGSIQI